MRIVDITHRFARLEKRSGAYMRSWWNSDTSSMVLSYSWGDKAPIAEIYDYKDRENFRLRIFTRPNKAGRTEHINRVSYVLQSVQRSVVDDWNRVRYSAYIQYELKIYDRELRAAYNIERTMEFVFRDGRLVLDYAHLESQAFPNEATPPPQTTPNANSNLQSVDSKLNAILAGV
jgi:hypothetical protein